jgi:four helix bundle protein
MAKIERFEEIASWRRARALVKEIYQLTGQGQFARDFGLRDQLRRAAGSIMSNVAEGFERGINKDLRHFLHIAKGSAGEVRSPLYVAFDSGYITESQQAQLTEQIIQIGNALGGFIRYLDSDLAAATNGKRTLREDDLTPYDPNFER